MAPRAACSRDPASDTLSMMGDNLGVVTEEPVAFLGLPALMEPKLHPRRKRLEVDSLDRRRMLQVFRKAFRHLRAALFRVLNRCTAAVKALCHVGLLSHRMTDACVVPYKSMESCREDEGSTLQGVVWTPGVPQDEEPECVPDEKMVNEEDSVAASDKIMEGDNLGETVTEELVCALVDWLEWDTTEEEEFCTEVPLKGLHGFPLPCLEISSVPSPTTASSKGEVEWDSDSSWDDDDSDEDLERNSELWESFMCNNDPYNPFKCSPVSAVNDRHVKMESCTQRPLQMSGRREDVCDIELPSPEDKAVVSSRKVRFSNVVKVHPLATWSFASRAARDGSCWQEMARDRARFKRRVDAVSEIISPCLLPEHRAMVWERVQLL